ncbi:hypothetical protein GCWU000341_01929 [Oribacterium sp. oral taxon 078 str. F0262]|nr:hypothetical protein GCWU000341_01929 [Oribacterium sp. oral taxon 078 str. F0262]
MQVFFEENSTGREEQKRSTEKEDGHGKGGASGGEAPSCFRAA